LREITTGGFDRDVRAPDAGLERYKSVDLCRVAIDDEGIVKISCTE